jgi:hypothetical protein
MPKPKKVGRPILPKGEAKASIVPVRFSPEDRKKVERAAKASNQSVSQWIRSMPEPNQIRTLPLFPLILFVLNILAENQTNAIITCLF